MRLMVIEEKRPLLSLSLDLDNQWSYMKTRGDPGWKKFPSYFDVLIPVLLDLLDQHKLKITFFVVGQDANLDKNYKALEQIVEQDHEIGNHSYNHDPWLQFYSKGKVEKEILDTEKLICDITGKNPVGFRGPGFTWSKSLIEILIENKYIFDASTLPTFLGPLARIFYFWKTDLADKEKKQRKDLYGNISDGLRPVKPYNWELSKNEHLLEIPVTTIPMLKLPFHLSYLLYLSRFSDRLMHFYLNIALAFCRMTKTEPSFLLHPLDFLDSKQVPELAFFPGMDLSREHKMRIFNKVINTLQRHFTLVNMNSHSTAILARDRLKTIPIK